MKRLFLALLGACAAAAIGSAQFTDQFNTTVSGRWSAPVSAFGPSDSNVSGLSFSQDNANSRIDWMLVLGGSGGAARMTYLQTHTGTYNADWTVELTVNNAFSAAVGQGTQIGLMLFNSEGKDDSLTADYVKLVLQQAPSSGNGDSIHYGLHSNTNANPSTNTTFNGTSSVLKLVYTASSHTIATYYDNNLLATYGIAGTGGDVAQNWGMASGGTFTLGLFAQATSSTTGYTLSAGTVNIDALTITGFGTAVPEPSTYAALAGLLALGFVAWRRRAA